jgi:hypothetical protein
MPVERRRVRPGEERRVADDSKECPVRGGNRGGLRRSTGGRRTRGIVQLVLSRDCVDGVVHGDLNDRHRSRLLDGRQRGYHCDLSRDVVPIHDRIACTRQGGQCHRPDSGGNAEAQPSSSRPRQLVN